MTVSVSLLQQQYHHRLTGSHLPVGHQTTFDIQWGAPSITYKSQYQVYCKLRLHVHSYLHKTGCSQSLFQQQWHQPCLLPLHLLHCRHLLQVDGLQLLLLDIPLLVLQAPAPEFSFPLVLVRYLLLQPKAFLLLEQTTPLLQKEKLMGRCWDKSAMGTLMKLMVVVVVKSSRKCWLEMRERKGVGLKTAVS